MLSYRLGTYKEFYPGLGPDWTPDPSLHLHHHSEQASLATNIRVL